MTLQLSVRGEQDVYITGKPSITYFSSLYKRITPFVSEYVEYPFDTKIPGTAAVTAIITIPSKGDVITDICVRNIFSKLYPSSLSGYYYGKIVNQILNAYIVTASGTVVLAIQTVITRLYYSTLNILTWTIPQVADISMAYSDTRFTFSTQNSTYNTLSFKDEDSAAFFGFNILTPTAPLVGTGIIASYKFGPSGYADNLFTLVGATPATLHTYCLASQDLNNIYIITGAETIQKYIVSSGTAGTIYTTGAPATYTTIIQTATDFNQTMYVTLFVNYIVTAAFSRIVSINTTTGVVTGVTDNTAWAGGSNNRYFLSVAYLNSKLFFTITDGNFIVKTIGCLSDTSFSTSLTSVQRLRSFPNNTNLYASNGNSLYSVNTTTGATTFILDAKDSILDFMLTVNSIFVSYGRHSSVDIVVVSKLTINRYDLTGNFMSSYAIKPGISAFSFAYYGTTIYTTMGDSTIYSKNVTTVTVPVYSVTSGMTLEQSGWIPGFSPTVNLDGTNPYSYTDSYPLTLIKEARLYIGNQLISRLSGDYIKLLKDYDTGYENRAGVNIINGMGDTSVKYTPVITMTSLPFGIKNLPITYRQSTQVQIDFGDISSVLNAPTTNPLYLTSSYSITQMSNILSVPTLQAQNIYSYSNTLIITENGPYITFFDLNKTTTDPTAYSRRVNGNGLTYSSAIIGGYMYNYSGYYATRILVTDYLSLTGTPTTSAIPIWAYGNPAYYVPMTVLNDARYIYYVLSVSSEKITTSGGNYVTITSYSGGGLSYVNLTFYGITTANANGAHAEVYNRVASRGLYPAAGYDTFNIQTYDLYSETTDGTNCYVTVRWGFNGNPPIERLWGTAVVVRYDTTADFNLRSSYTFGNDFSNIYVASPNGGGVPLRFPVVYPTVATSTIRAFIDNFSIYCVVTNQTTYVLYETPTMYIVNIASFTPSFLPLYIGGLSLPYFNDGAYVYFSIYNSGVISRFKINTSVEIGSSWDSFDLYSNFPSIFSFTAEAIKQFSPGSFDGRYVYYSGTLTGSGGSPIILKYDTTKPFTQAGSYSVVMKQWKQLNKFVTATGATLDVSFSRYSPNAFIFSRPTSTSQMLVFMNNISDPTNTNQLSDVLQINTGQLDETYTFAPTMLIEYAYIDTAEQQFFKKYPQNIVYETLQTNKFQVTPGVSSLPLRLLNPVKELYIYSNTYSNINSFQMLLNGQDLFNLDSAYLRSIEPIEFNTVAPFYNTYMYDFVFPVNMSRIATKSLTVSQGANTTIIVQAKTLNVLVIKDGLAGVLFNSLEYVV